ncbi:MAG: hypothetical protein V4673_07890 [Pseudomonadota bacterium]
MPLIPSDAHCRVRNAMAGMISGRPDDPRRCRSPLGLPRSNSIGCESDLAELHLAELDLAELDLAAFDLANSIWRI